MSLLQKDTWEFTQAVHFTVPVCAAGASVSVDAEELRSTGTTAEWLKPRANLHWEGKTRSRLVLEYSIDQPSVTTCAHIFMRTSCNGNMVRPIIKPVFKDDECVATKGKLVFEAAQLPLPDCLKPSSSWFEFRLQIRCRVNARRSLRSGEAIHFHMLPDHVAPAFACLEYESSRRSPSARATIVALKSSDGWFVSWDPKCLPPDVLARFDPDAPLRLMAETPPGGKRVPIVCDASRAVVHAFMWCSLTGWPPHKRHASAVKRLRGFLGTE